MLSHICDKWDCTSHLSPTKHVKSVIAPLQVDVEPPASLNWWKEVERMTDYELLSLVFLAISQTAILIISIINLVIKLIDREKKESYPSRKEK